MVLVEVKSSPRRVIESSRLRMILEALERFEGNGEVIVRFRDGVPVEIELRPRIHIREIEPA